MSDGEEGDHEGLQFSDDFESLPANSPENHAHVIGDPINQGLHYGGVTIWDAIATMLYKISLETLQKFLNSQYNSFKLLNKRSTRVSLMIWRTDAKVLVSPPQLV